MSKYMVGVTDEDFDDFRRTERAFDDLCTKYLELREKLGYFELDRTYAMLRAELEALRTENEERSAKFDKVNVEKTATILQLRVQLEAQQSYGVKLANEISDLRETWRIPVAENEQLRTELKAQNEANDMLSEERDSFDGSLRIEQQINKDLRAERDQLLEKYENAKTNFNAMAAECQRLMQRTFYTKCDETITKLGTGRDALRTERDGLKANYDLLNADHAGLVRKYTELLGAMARVHNAIPRNLRGNDQ